MLDTERLHTEKKVTLSESAEDFSRAEVSLRLRTEEGFVANTLNISVHAEPNGEDQREVWVSLRVHDYTQLGDLWSSPTVSRGFEILTHSFSRAEAEALVAVLSHELAKFEDYDKSALY